MQKAPFLNYCTEAGNDDVTGEPYDHEWDTRGFCTNCEMAHPNHR